eukprot:10818055-Alexandrium_andersonii.AAC.1
MLAPPHQAVRAGSPGRAYVDPELLKPGALLALACRVAVAGMLRGVKRKRGGVGLFTVIKSAELVDGKVKATLRLVFDQRFDNLGWAEPPWAGLCDPSALAGLDLSEVWTEQSVFEVACGD